MKVRVKKDRCLTRRKKNFAREGERNAIEFVFKEKTDG